MKLLRGSTLFMLLACITFLSTSKSPAKDTARDETKYVLYYLHNTFRCYSCNKIEMLSKTALLGGKIEEPGKNDITVSNSAFSAKVKAGELSFSSLNVDKEENKHYLTDLLCKPKFPVIAEYKDGKLVRSKTFDKVWAMLNGDPHKFVSYIQKSVADFINSAK